MACIDLILPEKGLRRWQATIVDRLRVTGHDVAVIRTGSGSTSLPTLDLILALEGRLLSSRRCDLATVVEGPAALASPRAAELAIDLTGASANRVAPTLTIAFDGSRCVSTAARVLANGGLPDLSLSLDGEPVATAAPMVDSRVLLSRGLDDILARAITLVVTTAEQFVEGRLAAIVPKPIAAPAVPPTRGLAGAYLSSTLPRLVKRAARRLCYRDHHWRVGYRFVDGPGVAETGTLSGGAWSMLPEDGQRFYADPFPFAWDGRHFIFVEELPYATGKGVISVAEIDANGHVIGTGPVLEEPHHLSYPQVFARDGEIWMLPEGGAGNSLILYRAEDFPRRWTRHRTLIEGEDLFDATLLDRDGKLWLFATQRDHGGSASDTLVVFHAESLEGPWMPHPMNPILIDRSRARPGGAVVEIDGRIFLPVQNGTQCYGGGLGLSKIIHLDAAMVTMAPPVGIDIRSDWPYPHIHTLNRAGRLETIDGIDESVPRPRSICRIAMAPDPAVAATAARTVLT